ncbi:MAG: zf-HC2 domain-containing protein [Planctomycetota bacterium]|nr:MAG: zf-HC2 domain-containing protein [Planctomycetota bacterium]
MTAPADLPTWPPGNCEEVSLWLNARSDGECTPAQEGWLAEHLQGCARCSREWAELERLRLAFACARLREPADFEREALRRALGPRLLETAGWSLFVGGALILAVFAAMEMFDDEGPLLQHLAVAALLGGLGLLFLRILLERLRVRRHDPYREVRR